MYGNWHIYVEYLEDEYKYDRGGRVACRKIIGKNR